MSRPTGLERLRRAKELRNQAKTMAGRAKDKAEEVAEKLELQGIKELTPRVGKRRKKPSSKPSDIRA